jgi:hypothetical protein
MRRHTNRADVDCLISTLNKGHKTHVNWKGKRCAGLTPKWDCKNRTCDVSEPPSHNANCFGCLRDDDGDDDPDAAATFDDSASATLHAQPKALRSNAAPTGEGALIPPHTGHTSHAAHACALPRTLEQTCKATALLRSFSAAQPL